MTETKTASVYARGIDARIKKDFKTLCARHSITINKAIEHLMRLAIHHQIDIKSTKETQDGY